MSAAGQMPAAENFFLVIFRCHTNCSESNLIKVQLCTSKKLPLLKATLLPLLAAV